ncbi:MAG: hypothetical protein R2755_20245 [Acidimicrobiales bacterium]
MLAGTDSPTDLETATAFFHSLGEGAAVMVKALAGGGGRGMRPVTDVADLAEAMERCRSEAQAVARQRRRVPRAAAARRPPRGGAAGGRRPRLVSHLWERECSVQRQRQKLVEIAPAPGLPAGARQRVLDAAVRLAAEVGYRSLGTVEFLVDARGDDDAIVAFMEVNARVQVEHTVTEEVTGVDLVSAQLQLAAGATLASLGLTQAEVADPAGFAVQARVNLETMQPDGTARPPAGCWPPTTRRRVPACVPMGTATPVTPPAPATTR